MAKAKIQGHVVIFNEGRVFCEDAKIRRLADLLTRSVPEYEAEPDNQRALLAVKKIGGVILELDVDEIDQPGMFY